MSVLHHFPFGRYQSARWTNWGRLRVLNRVEFGAGGRGAPDVLDGMEVILFVHSGAVRLQFGDRDTVLQSGEVGVVAMGLGGEYAIETLGVVADVTEIWIPHEGPEQPTFHRGIHSAPRSVLASCHRQDRPVAPLESEARVWFIDVKAGTAPSLFLTGSSAYLCMLHGCAVIAGISCEKGDGLAVAAECFLSVDASATSRLLIIETLD